MHCHPVQLVILLAVALRIWLSIDLPLIITNDGVGYIDWAREFAAGQPSSIPPIRTPGYPLFLAGIFTVFGESGLGVLVAQHVLGVITAALIAWAVLRTHGSSWAIACGLIAATCPALVMWECYALTETLTVMLVVTSLVLTLTSRSSPLNSILLGIALGLACLTRPTIQLFVPFIVLAWLLRSRHWRRALAMGGITAASLLMTLAPWLVHNHRRNITGLAAGGSTAFWWGLAMNQCLDDSFPLPSLMQSAYARLKTKPPTDATIGRFVSDVNAWNDPSVQRTLAEWSGASVLTRPTAYCQGVLNSLRGQIEWRPSMDTDTGWFLWRLSEDGAASGQSAPNFQVTEPSPPPDSFRMHAPRGLSARLAAWFSHHHLRGLPAGGLLIIATLAGLYSFRMRRWPETMAIAGTVALFAVHPMMLLPFSRYSVVPWTCWIVVLPVAANATTGALSCIRRRTNSGSNQSPVR